METVRLVWQLLIAVVVCNAAHILDEISSILSPQEIDGLVQELKLPTTKISLEEPLPQKNLDNAEKGPASSLSGDLLPSLLSVLSKSQHFDRRAGGDGYEINCRDSKQVDPNEQVSGDEVGNFNKNNEETESNRPLINADIDVLSRDYEGNYPDIQTTESSGSLIDADDVSNREGDENDSDEQTIESDGSLIDADDVSNREGEDNDPDEQTTENDGSLIDADVDALSKCHGENNSDGYSTESGVSSTDEDDLSSDENNSNDYSTESSRSSSANDDLADNDEENNSNEPTNINSESLGNADTISKCHTDNNSDSYSTESEMSSTDDYYDNSSSDENSSNDYSTESASSSTTDDAGDVSRDNAENSSDEQSTKSEGSLVNADVNVLTSEEHPSGTTGGILKRDVSSAGDTTNLRNIDSNYKVKQDLLDLDRSNTGMFDNSGKYSEHYVKNNPLKIEKEQPSENNNYFTEEMSTGQFKIKIFIKNIDGGVQHLPFNAKSDENHMNNVNIPSKSVHSNKRNDKGFNNQHYLESRDGHSTNNEDQYRRVLPFVYRRNLFPARPVTNMMPLGWNLQGGYLQYFQPEDSIFRRNAVPSTRMFPLRIVTQAGYPLMAEMPQSVASSNLYGSSASAGMIPTNRYGCPGAGVVGGSETSQTSSETTVVSSETTVDSSESTV